MQAARRLEALSERPEDHRENGAEGAMETADGIGKRVRVLLDGGGDPGMSELQQQRTARSQEGRGLPIDLPGDRPRTEYACERTGRRTAYQVQLALQVFRADDFERVMLCWRVHSCRLDGPAGDVLPLEHASLKERALLVATADSTNSQRSIGARQKLALPCQRVAHDGLQVVETRLPFEQRTGTVGSRHDLCRVAGTPAGERDLEVDAQDPLYRLDHLEHGTTP